MNDLPWTTVVIPTYGMKGVKLVEQCVDSLIKTHQHVLPEIIVVSDGDDEDAMTALRVMAEEKNMFGLARIERAGFAAACNAGIRLASGQFGVFLVNNDITFEVNCLQILNDAMLTMNAGIIGCLLLYPDRTIQHAGVAYVPNTSADAQIPGYFDHLLRFQPENHLDAVVMNTGLVTGALMGISRAFIDRSGYLDQRFGFTCEDIDLCLRAYECNLPPIYCGYTYAIHAEGASRGRTPEEKMALEPEIAKKEMEALAFLHQKYITLNLTRFSVHGKPAA